MSRRKPWEEPIRYVEDRFPDEAGQQPAGDLKPDPDLVVSRIRDAQSGKKTTTTDTPKPTPRRPVTPTGGSQRSADSPRPNWRDGVAGRSNDDAPLNYNRGPHDGELDVDDRDELD